MGLGMGPGGLVFMKTPLCPPRRIFITSKCQDLVPPSSELASHCPLVGEPPLPQLGTEGVGQGRGVPPVHTCHTPGILAGFVFILIFFFGFDFLIRIFILSTFILKESVLCIGGSWIQSWGGGPWGRAVAQRGPHSLCVSLCSPALLPSLFLLFSL